MLKLLFVGTALATLGFGAALAEPFPSGQGARPPMVLVSGGCGIAFHRTPFGDCVRNFIRPCPRGYHRDPDPYRPVCYPNF